MASKKYRLSWEEKAKQLEDVNARLASQLSKADEMFDDLYNLIKLLDARVTELE